MTLCGSGAGAGADVSLAGSGSGPLTNQARETCEPAPSRRPGGDLMGGDNHREAKANMFVRRFDDVADAAGCDVPVSVLASLVRLSGEALEAPLTSMGGRT
jgi:hypothetical protein